MVSNHRLCYEAVKNGKMQGKQRYRCKSCGCNYTQSTKYRIAHETRVECIKLYMQGLGFRSIERVTGLSHVIIQHWVKELGDKIEALCPQTGEIIQVNVMEIDEMWPFVQKERTNAGSG